MVAATSERVRDNLIRLVHSGADVRDFALGAARILDRAVRFDGVCVATMDPRRWCRPPRCSRTGRQLRRRAAEGDQVRREDFISLPSLSLSERHAATLSQATDGVLDRGERHRRSWVRTASAMSCARCSSTTGTWGALSLLRGSDREPFSATDTALVEAVSAELAEGLRRSVLLDRAAPRPLGGEDAAGVLVLAPDGSAAYTDEVAASWIDELGGNGSVSPVVVTAVATQARTVAAGLTRDVRIARARVRAKSGRWLVVRGSVLGDERDAPVAVMIEPARPDELAPLVADAFGLTERERDVTQLVAHGLPTDAIAEQLHLSPWTVQDHLKAIFEKVGVTTRGALVARLFFQQRAPRLTEP